MKKLVQAAAGGAVMFLLAPHTFGTPLHHWMVYVPLFIGTMYGVALVQHRLHWRPR
jgi:hypothetical protein